MFVKVNGARLCFGVEGTGLVPDGSRMREKPTLLLLRGGPGVDHTIYKPAFSALSGIAQVIYLDHRGSGRSSCDDPATWRLAQWADDVRGFCDASGIEKPVVLGTSFDAFEDLGGEKARQAAEAYWLAPSPETRLRYRDVCVPLYRARPSGNGSVLSRAIIRDAVAIHFNGPANEQGRMDFRQALAQVRCPVLVMAGDRDPITPIQFSEEIVRCLPEHLVRFERFPGCGHGVQADDPGRAFAVLRDFIAGEAIAGEA